MDALYLGLCALDDVAEDLGIDGLVFGHLEGCHDALGPVAAELAHQVILQRQVEGALAGVTLTTGAAAQLVVDTAAFVALGTDDAQTAGLTHQIGSRFDGFLVLSQLFTEQCSGLQNLRIVGLGIAGGLGDDLVAVAGLLPDLPLPCIRRYRPA